ncbi:glycosyltransferase [Pontibacter arcticus]|uniref:Glycoside hydrolase family 2 n=1 Tax=Pontibacter arcticus TaxID=2080288 RepID=A0A364RDP0_9BACT|nr:glycosyltransferase [Pontibacter arcticus]RAU82365.1 glycoside hydrolase family 2 [Pontibacter arcticus]
MQTKVLEVELSEGLTAIQVDAAYKSYHILVRYNRLPLGWITIPTAQVNQITKEHLEEVIKNKIGYRLLHQAQRRQFMPVQASVPAAHTSEGISVIVCTRNRTQFLARCLDTLFTLEYPTFEIIVVDNAPSNNDTLELTTGMPVRYVREDRPGLDWARNRGIAEANYSIVAFTDDDACVDKFWLQAIAKTLADPDVTAVTGLVAPAELETRAQHIFEFGYGGMGHGFSYRKLSRKTLSDRQMLRSGSVGIGVNMAFRRAIFQQTGLFDTALDVGTPSCGAGDIEMFFRLLSKGYTFVYDPAMLVWHTHRQHLPELQKQIKDNGRSFGCYLITCFKNKNIKLSSILIFFLLDWIGTWHFRNFLKPRAPLSRKFVLIELAGMLQSPGAYRASQAYACKIAAKTPSEDKQAYIRNEPAAPVPSQQVQEKTNSNA